MLINNGLDFTKRPKKPIRDADALRKMFEEAGFKSLKIFPHNVIFWSTPEEGIQILVKYEPFKSFWEEITDEKKKEIVDSYIIRMNELIGEDSNEVSIGEFNIILAKK